MSSEKINSTINNLCQKYETSSWKNILPIVFKGNNFSQLLDQLLTDVEQGVKWAPSFKDVFSTFNNVDIKTLEVVVLSTNPLNIVTEQLKTQGVIYLSIPMFKGVEDQSSERYQEHSEIVMVDIISKLAYQTTGVVFVFVGDGVENISKCIDSKHHRKVFIPEEYREDMDMKKIVNKMLKSPIKWD